MKRGLGSSCVHSALAMTRRDRLQLVRVIQLKSLKRRAGFSALFGGGLRGRELRSDLGDQAGVAGKPEDIIHAVRLAPRHQVLARKAAVGAQNDAHERPAAPDLRDDPPHFLHRASRPIDVRATKLGPQKVPPAEHIKRHIAMAVVIAVEKPPFLIPVQRIVGGIEIENDLLRHPFVRLQE